VSAHPYEAAIAAQMLALGDATARVQHYAAHPLWFDATDDELARWCDVPVSLVRRVRRGPRGPA